MTNPFPYPQPSTAPAPGMEALLEPVAGVALAGDCREPGRLLAEVGRGQAEVPRGFWFNGRVELKHMFGVNKGDTVKLSVKAYYENDPATDAMLSAAEMLAQILMGAEGGPAAGEGASVSNSTLDESAVAAMNANKSASAQEDVPKAFLNYMFFDEDMTFVTSGFVQITGAAKNLWENVAFANPIVIEENGYFLTYVSNETNAASVVDFDDLTVTHSKTPIVQVDDYYPFGLTFNSFTRSYSTPQRFKYNGFEFQTDWGVYDYQARYYDPAIGRFLMVDPAADLMRRHSTYSYAYDNPIRFIDPDGMMPDCPNGDCWGALKEAVGEMKANSQAIMDKGKKLLNDANVALNNAGETISDAATLTGNAILDGLQAAQDYVFGDHDPDTNTDKTNMVGKVLDGEGDIGGTPVIEANTDGEIDVSQEQRLGINGPPGESGDWEAATEMIFLAGETAADLIIEGSGPSSTTSNPKPHLIKLDSQKIKSSKDPTTGRIRTTYYIPSFIVQNGDTTWSGGTTKTH